MSRPAILLDRDGTIIVEKHYLSDPAQVVLEKGVGDGLRRLSAAGYALVLVSNQSGIGRGYFTEADLQHVNARLQVLLHAEGVTLQGMYHCPHAPDAPCACRKPLPGMALQAEKDLGLDLARSWVVGDKRADLELAAAVGAGAVLVLTGHGAADADWARTERLAVCADFTAAAAHILAQGKASS